MDLNGLETFLVVVREGSFSAAARFLGVSPSHVSRQIASLEEAINVRLFQRTTRRLTLTPTGERYAAEIQPLLETLRKTSEWIGEAEGTVSGTVRIAAPAPFVSEQMIYWLIALRRQHPGLRLDIQLDPRHVDVVEQRIDLAVRLGSLPDSSLIATKLCDMPRVIIASPTYLEARGRPSRPEDLVEHDCLLFPYEGYGSTWSFRDGRGQITRANLDPSIVLTDGIALRALAVAGGGLALLPRWLVAPALHDGRLIELFTDYRVTGTEPDAAIWLVLPSREHVPLRVRVVADFIRAQFEGGSPWEGRRR